MRLKEYYNIYNKKRNIKFQSIVILLVVFFAINMFYTLGRFSNTVFGNTSLTIAKWFLLINNEQISGNTTVLSSATPLVNSNDGTTNIDVGDECYFDITLNPSTTEVAVNYTISIDLTDASSTLPTGTKIKKYEKYNIDGTQLISTTNVNATSLTINDNMNLANSGVALASSDAVKYRIYCQMPDFANLVQNTALSITPQITVSQILNSD